MNKDLYDKTIKIPDEVLEYLDKCFQSASGADESIEGFKRNQELRQNGTITYQGLKRIKNFFDSFDGYNNDLSYILNGAEYMKNWVNDTLTSMRDEINQSKKNKSITSPDNEFNDNNSLVPDNLKNMFNQHSSSADSLKVNENIERINYLIKKII